MDRFPQLAFKAYLYADRNEPYAAGRDNRYAPFYLWQDTEGMNAFLGGAGFAGVVASFGRPIVRTWSVWQARTVADLSVATHASCESMAMDEHVALADVREREAADAQVDLERGALAAISAFDPSGWTCMRFRLWRDVVGISGEKADIYQVGHVSQPHR